MLMRRRAVVTLGLLVMVAAGACRRAEPNSSLGLSPTFHVAAARLQQFIGERLVQSLDLQTFESRLADARAQFAELRTKATTDSDRLVLLLIALEMTKDNQRKRLVFQTSESPAFAAVREDIQRLYEEREQCWTELNGWLGYRPTDKATLTSGPCLSEARQATAMLLGE